MPDTSGKDGNNVTAVSVARYALRNLTGIPARGLFGVSQQCVRCTLPYIRGSKQLDGNSSEEIRCEPQRGGGLATIIATQGGGGSSREKDCCVTAWWRWLAELERTFRGFEREGRLCPSMCVGGSTVCSRKELHGDPSDKGCCYIIAAFGRSSLPQHNARRT